MKNQLRREILKRRESLSHETVKANSQAIFRRLVSLDCYQKAKTIMVYLSMKNEVATGAWPQLFLADHKRVFVPATEPGTRNMAASELLDPETDLLIGPLGILEPKKEALRPIPPSELDLVLVPGVVFDYQGYRIGYGGGYYDRFLPRLASHATTIGLAHSLQLVENTFPESHDIPVHMILTEPSSYDDPTAFFCRKTKQLQGFLGLRRLSRGR